MNKTYYVVFVDGINRYSLHVKHYRSKPDKYIFMETFTIIYCEDGLHYASASGKTMESAFASFLIRLDFVKKMDLSKMDIKPPGLYAG